MDWTTDRRGCDDHEMDKLENPADDGPRYEVELERDGVGAYTGAIYLVDGDTRTYARDLGGVFGSRSAAITAAREVARRHRAGDDIVRLDIDE